MYSIELKDEDVTALFARIDAGLGNTAELMNDIGAAMVRSTKDRIARGLQPDGAPFAPRSPTTLSVYEQAGTSYGALPLNKSGDMARGIFHDYGPDEVSWGSPAIQAAVMQFGAAKGAFGRTTRGAAIPWGNIPARPYLGLSEEDRTSIPEIVEDWLADIAERGR